jgi:hypothetical protein
MTSTLGNLREKLNSLGKAKEPSSGVRRDDVTPHFANEEVSLPRVNLLPQSVRDSIRIGALLRRAGITAVALIAVTAVIWIFQGPTIDQAQGKLDQAQSDNQTLNTQIKSLSPIGELYSALTRQQEFVQDTLAASPTASEIFIRLQDAASDTGKTPVQITSASIAYHGIPESGDTLNPCPNPDPFNESITFGCLSFNASASSRDQISSFLNNIATDPLFVGAYVDSSVVNPSITDGNQSKENQVTFSGSVGVTLEGLQTPLTPEEIMEIITPAPDTTTDPNATTDEVN